MPEPVLLPKDGPVRVNDLDLPAGHRLIVHSTDGPMRDETRTLSPSIWATDDLQSDAGRWWWALQGVEGLSPVLLDSLDNEEPFGRRRPWDVTEDLEDWNPSIPDESEVSDILVSTFWDQDDEEAFENFFAPYQEFPGLAPAQSLVVPASQLESTIVNQPPAWFGLVRTNHSYEIPIRAGWFATSPVFFPGTWGRWDPAGAMTAILRSWETRFGARVFRMGFASLSVLVERPPQTSDEALRVAAELCQASDEFHTPPLRGAVTTVPRIAARIVGAPVWRLWWD
jgi:hypothetical protein